MTLITMSNKELDKYQIIKKLIAGHLKGGRAADLLNLSLRQVRRLKGKVKKLGAKGLIHGNRGQASPHRLDDQQKETIVAILTKHYYDFGPTFASEKLRENHDINHDPKTIRQIMIDQGLWKLGSKKLTSVHRQWRERKAAFGEMLQFDGSYEHWFEERGPKCCLLAAIDDATSQVVYAKFDFHEGVFPVFAFWQEYIQNMGKPRSIYLDKFSTYHMNHTLAKENPETLTQFQRAMQELQVEVIVAHSPEAKGRVERLFRTLQDRLIKELRLAKISTMSEANEFLKTYLLKFNAQFAVQPRSNLNLHQTLIGKEQHRLTSIFSRQTIRTVQNDFTISFNKCWYQLTKEQPATISKKDKVIMEERLDGTIHIRLRGKYLNYCLLPARPVKISKILPWILPSSAPLSKAHKPTPNHPWRQAWRIPVKQAR